MQPCLCKNHFRQVSNVFDKETAFAFALDDQNCVICNKVIFIEGAHRFVAQNQVGATQLNGSDQTLRLPDAFIHTGA